MRTLSTLQGQILSADTKQIWWLAEIDQDQDGSTDYYWGTTNKTWDGHDYEAKITELAPLTLTLATPELSVIPPCKTTLKINFPGSQIDGLYASDFEGAYVTLRLIGGIPAGSAELMAWRFRVINASSLDQILTLCLQDWFTLKLEGDYPNTPLVSDIFRADIMKNDNACIPLIFGPCYPPARWISFRQDATYTDSDTFTVEGDQTGLFSAGQFVHGHCGEDGKKGCWVDSSSYADGETTVNLTAGSADLTENLEAVSTDHYILGPGGLTYTATRARTPQEVNFKSTYLAADYTFKVDDVTGSDGETYKGLQVLCHDANKDGTNDANGYWGIAGKQIYDMPVYYSRSDTATTTDPAQIAKAIFLDWGIPTGEIDDTSRAAATAIFAGRGLTLAVGLWYKQAREKLISKLFAMCGMVPQYRDKIGFKILTKTSQMTITENMIKPGTFQIVPTYTQKEKDSGYVTWQVETEPADRVNKTRIAAKATTNNIADTTIEAEWIKDSEMAQIAGKLALQKILLRDKTITFTATSKIAGLEPGDMVTMEAENLGGEAAGYNCMITKMTIREGLWIDVECIRFAADLDDWEDLSADSLTIEEERAEQGITPLYQGPTDASGDAGETGNKIYQTLLIGEGGTLATNNDPATNGGFMATDTEMTCYNEAGGIRFRAVYGGTDQGDVTMGDWDGGQGVKWDQSDETLSIRVNETGGITVQGGGDITLEGSDTDPGKINFKGTSYGVEMGGDADGNRFLIKPDANNAVDFHIGINGAWWGEADTRFRDIRIYAKRQSFITCGDWTGAVNGAAVEIDGDTGDAEPAITFTLYDKTSETLCQYQVMHDHISPADHKLKDLGGSAAAWDDAYADDFNNVADFFFLDHRQDGKEITPVDDLGIIKGIKPSGIFDPRTGLEIIDDNSLPDWILSRHKQTGRIMRDPDGKPYLSLKVMISLCMGAIRQLEKKTIKKEE